MPRSAAQPDMGAVLNFPTNPPPVHEQFQHGVQLWARLGADGRGHEIGVWMVENPSAPILRIFTSAPKAFAYAAALSCRFSAPVFAHGDEARKLIDKQPK